MERARLYRLARSKAYLFAGVEIRWRCDASLINDGEEIPAEAVFQFPGGLADHLNEQIGGRETATNAPFVGRHDFPGEQGKVEWASYSAPERPEEANRSDMDQL